MEKQSVQLPSFKFPADLERVIFETAVYCHPPSIPTLILVAWRVKLWPMEVSRVEPLLYRTIMLRPKLGYGPLEGCPIFSSQMFRHIIRSKGTSFLTTAVRKFFLPVMPLKDGQTALSACRGINELWVDDANAEIEALAPLIWDLPLKRLYCSLEHIFGSQRKIDFTHRLFSQITHLEVFDYPSVVDPDIWCNLALLPRLTHLSFDHKVFRDVWPTLLRECPSLRVLVAFASSWAVGAQTGMDYWSKAEEFIAKRRSGEVDESVLPLLCGLLNSAYLRHSEVPESWTAEQKVRMQNVSAPIPFTKVTMSDTQIPMFIPASAPSLPTSTSTSSTRILRERCGFTLFISFGPAFPSIPAKGHIGPTAGNLPRRKRSSVISLELPAPVPLADANAGRMDRGRAGKVEAGFLDAVLRPENTRLDPLPVALAYGQTAYVPLQHRQIPGFVSRMQTLNNLVLIP
ncbi:hypothetical protein B0H13DRAFT_2413911 [Mycena leptocephala]|nr:hypothetical protein B0H13DRAFT_2413911 [Mycena leptocephala]